LCSSFNTTLDNAPHPMIRIYTRATLRSPAPLKWRSLQTQRSFSCTQWRKEETAVKGDPRLEDFGRSITDEFAEMREKYRKIKFASLLLAQRLTKAQRRQ
jgi:triacylglycerol lipase